MLYSIPNVCLQIDWKSYNIFLQKKYIMVGRYQVSPQKPKCNWTRGLIIVYNPNTLHITVFIAKLLPESKGAFEEHIIPIAVKAPFSLLFLSQSARNHHGEQGERGVTSESRQRQEAGWEEAERQKSPLFWLSCGGWRENVRPPRGAVALRISSTLSGSKLKLRVSLKKNSSSHETIRGTPAMSRGSAVVWRWWCWLSVF